MKRAIIWSDEQLLSLQKAIFEKLKEKKSDLQKIAASHRPVVEKWQEFLQILLPIQAEILAPDQKGILEFNRQYMERSKQNSELAQVNKEKWVFLFTNAFGLLTYKEIREEEAYGMISAIAERMMSEEFLQQVDRAVSECSQALVERRKALLHLLFPLQREVMALYGFEGDEGYIQAQRALLDHYSSPRIQTLVHQAQTIVFKRAGLL